MPPITPAARRVRCPTCRVRRGNRCRGTQGQPVAWHHVDRHSLADGDTKGAPRRPIPPEVRRLVAAGTPLREVARLFGIPRSTLHRHGIRPGRAA